MVALGVQGVGYDGPAFPVEAGKEGAQTP